MATRLDTVSQLSFFQHNAKVKTGRLQFLDGTLERMIQRFEDEFPECRVAPPETTSPAGDNISDSGSLPSSFTDPFNNGRMDEVSPTSVAEDDGVAVRAPMSRQHSDVSLASRHLTQEEGQMHRFGQQIRRDILCPQTKDHAHGTTGNQVEANHLQSLRTKLEAMSGDEIKAKLEKFGSEFVLRELGTTADELLELEKQDPEGFEKFKQAHSVAQQNQRNNFSRSARAAI